MRLMKGMVGGDANAFIEYMGQRDPSFAAEAKRLMAMGPERAFAEAGLDYEQIKSMPIFAGML
jgi:hypothetical protein